VLLKRADQLDLRHRLALGEFADGLKTAHGKSRAEFDAISGYDEGAALMLY
jgi:hypothetical protein